MKRNAFLHIASSPREAWDGAIERWFREVLPVSWKKDLPSLVVVPTRSHAHALKGRLLEENYSHLGVPFVTPARLRDLLRDERDDAVPPREHVRLLLAAAAEETLSESSEDETDAVRLAAKAVLRAPAHLLRTLDRLETAGWDFEKLGLKSFQPIVQRFRKHLRACGFSGNAQFDRALLARSVSIPPHFANLLICGFDAAHWSQWFLLRAAVQASERTTVVLEEPRSELADSDLCWIGSWEETLGEARRPSRLARPQVDSFFSEAEMRGEAQPPSRFDFLIGLNTSEQAEAIAAQCVRYLAEEKCASPRRHFHRSRRVAAFGRQCACATRDST